MPSITIVVPAHNAELYISQTLRSVVEQTHPGWNLVVVDDGSTDRTAALARSVAPQATVLNGAREGVSRARNIGLSFSDTEYVLFLDADDVLEPDALDRLQSGFSTCYNAVASFGRFTKILPDGSAYPGQTDAGSARYPNGDVLRPMLKQNFLANGGHVLVRTEVARRVGGFDPSLRLSEDWEFWCRLAAQGPFVFISGAPVMSLRVHTSSSSGALSREWANHLPALERVKNNPALRARFSHTEWTSLERSITASHMWEAGRVNFTYEQFLLARRLMLGSLYLAPNPKRVALFMMAQLSQLVHRSLVSRLRFVSDDDQESRA